MNYPRLIKYIAGAVAGVLLILLCASIYHASLRKTGFMTQDKPSPPPRGGYSLPTPPTAALWIAPNQYPQVSLKDRNRAVAAHEAYERFRRDPDAEWKTAIAFYGKAVDEKYQPLSGVRVKMQWNDLSIKGTSQTETFSDSEGLFSLKNVTGKGLVILRQVVWAHRNLTASPLGNTVNQAKMVKMHQHNDHCG